MSHLYQQDLLQTRTNRDRLEENKNLLFWYQSLYEKLFKTIPDIQGKKILEIGSGTSPLKKFYPSIITSDILNLDYLDKVFDCHHIAECADIPDHSLNVITLTNVLHHLCDPLQFLRGATKKLMSQGEIYLVEPYFSWLSYPMYKLLHHEPVDFKIQRPLLEEITGPLSTSNQAMPHLIFFKRHDWLKELENYYAIAATRYEFFTSLSYPMTGGISRKFPIPSWLYRFIFPFDRLLADKLPKLFASFFIVKLVSL